LPLKVGGTLLNVGLVTEPAHELVKYPISKDVSASSRRLRQGNLCDYVPRAHDTGRECGISEECNECGVHPSARGFDAARNSECGMCGRAKFRGLRALCESMIFEKKSEMLVAGQGYCKMQRQKCPKLHKNTLKHTNAQFFLLFFFVPVSAGISRTTVGHSFAIRISSLEMPHWWRVRL